MNDTHTIHPFFKEKSILFPVILLAGLGVIMVYSASSAISMKTHDSVFYFMQKQAFFCVISLGLMFVAASFPYQFYKPMAYVILVASLALLCLVLVPSLSVKAGGAHRWIRLFGLTFQPAEPAKLALIIFLAYSLSKKQALIKVFSVGFIPHLFIFSLFALLIIFQPDFGTVAVLAVITWVMMFVAGVRILHLLSLVPLAIPVLYFLILKVDYRKERILAFLNPWADPYDTGYQITHSLKAFGSGGVFGKGLGLGMQKLHYLPEPHTDFIFSIIGEELGLLGVLGVFILYGVLIWKGARIARSAADTFGSILAFGLTTYLAIQMIINTGVALGVMPTKGLTLPFISYGGTSLMVNMLAVGILMNIGSQVDGKEQTNG